MKNLSLSVIIPTYNRKDILKKCLTAFFNQTYPQNMYEIIVVDDGSTDGTEEMIKTMINDSSYELRYFKQENKGPAAARNVGIRNAKKDLVLFIGDDIITIGTLLEEHVKWHKLHPEENVAILGYVTWSPEIKVTPFMKWLEESGAQFGYPLIKNPDDVSYNFFYTSNISMKRQFLLKYGLFDEDFPYAAWEDIELAYRLTWKDVRIVYNEKATGYHEHETDQKRFQKRSQLVGQAKAIFHQKHPELKESYSCVVRFNLKAIAKIFIWHLPAFMARFIPKKYLHISYGYMISRYIERGCEKWLR